MSCLGCASLTTSHALGCHSFEDGRPLWQNAASMAMFGCHGRFNSDTGMPTSTSSIEQDQDVNDVHLRGDNYLEILFSRSEVNVVSCMQSPS